MGTADLPHSTPSAEGVSAAGIEAFLDAVAAAGIELHSVIVLRHGKVLCEGWWTPYAPDRVHLLYSLSKSFASTAAGLAAAEGLLDLDDTVLSHFPEYDADITDPRSRAMKVRHVAAMASGHATETLGRVRAGDPAELVRGLLRIPPDGEPGTVFAYNQPCTYSLAAIVQRRSGQGLIDFLRPRLLDPLGIGPVGWLESPPGRAIGFSGLHATTDAIARLGLLYLQRGRWGDRQLLPEAWVAEATRKQVDNPNEPNPDWQQGYGFQFWMARHGYRGDGAYGQFCIVLPEQDMVIAITACTEDMQGVLDAAWAHILPAVDAPADPDADERLAQRLAAPALPTVAGKYEPAGDWDGAVFTVQSPPAPTDAPDFADDYPAIETVALRRAGDDWRLTLTDPEGPAEVTVGFGEWAVTDDADLAVAVSGAWPDDDTFEVDVLFIETAHGVRLRCSKSAGTAEAEWKGFPLHQGTLRQLRCPSPRG